MSVWFVLRWIWISSSLVVFPWLWNVRIGILWFVLCVVSATLVDVFRRMVVGRLGFSGVVGMSLLCCALVVLLLLCTDMVTLLVVFCVFDYSPWVGFSMLLTVCCWVGVLGWMFSDICPSGRPSMLFVFICLPRENGQRWSLSSEGGWESFIGESRCLMSVEAPCFDWDVEVCGIVCWLAF